MDNPPAAAAATARDMQRLGGLIRRLAPYDGEFHLRVPGVAVSRATRPHGALQHSVQQAALCVVAQGGKSVHIGAERYTYDPDHLMIYAVNLPIAFQVTQASVDRPFLTFKLALDPVRIAQLALELYPQGLPQRPDSRGVQVTDVTGAIVGAAARLLETVENEREARWIGPLIVDELFMRLLLSPAGPLVAQLGHVESSTQRVGRAIEWIQQHFDEPLNIGGLAELAHMGVSTFHAHFKALTGLSPLQFQKTLRLQEARRLMVATVMDAGAVSRQVGYASASQFTREYARLFGHTPRQDMVQLRAAGNALVAS